MRLQIALYIYHKLSDRVVGGLQGHFQTPGPEESCEISSFITSLHRQRKSRPLMTPGE